MKKISRIMSVGVVNIIVLFILCEISGLIHYYMTTEQLFYTRTQDRQAVVESADTPSRVNTVLHPFWGFTPRPSMKLRNYLSDLRLERLVGKDIVPDWIDVAVNEYGFYSTYLYPYIPQENELVVGVFGGSVAHWFALQGSKEFIKRLMQDDKTKDKSIVLLNFAQGGFKQPQQLQILTYFLAIGQKFDIVINIDGFNEVALSHINYQKNIDLSFPSGQHILPIAELVNDKDASLESLNALVNVGKARKTQKNVERIIYRNQSAGFNLILMLLRRNSDTNYADASRTLDSIRKDRSSGSNDLMHVNRLLKGLQSIHEFEYTSQLWSNSSILMKQILIQRKIKYLHILQPNQYYGERRVSSGEEFAINENSPYKIGVEQGYPFLVDKIGTLENQSVRVVNMTKIFDLVSDIVYSDSCCHYNQKGNEILAVGVAEEVLKILE